MAMHATTIAKIEAGTRSVRINEALGIADLFEISLDTLTRRANEPDDAVQLAFTLRVLRDTARTASDRTLDEAREIQQYVRQITTGYVFDGSDELAHLAGTACPHLDKAYDALAEMALYVEEVMKATAPITGRSTTRVKVKRL
jgi:hypothetical protein